MIPGDVLDEKAKKVLVYLSEETAPDGVWCTSFAPIEDGCVLFRHEVRDACRHLRFLGLAEFYRALWNFDTGKPAGAGYCISERGLEWLREHGEDSGTDKAPQHDESAQAADSL